MKRWQQWLSWHVALCVAFAGAVGVSPRLHLLVEHGGHGHAHSHHRHSAVSAAAHDHPHSHVRVGDGRDSGASELSRLIDRHHRHPRLLGVELKQVYRVLGGWVARAMKPFRAAPEDGDAGHTHHSLAQMLASGAVEGPVAPDAGLSNLGEVIFAVEQFSSAPSRSIFDAQSAGRAPPCIA